MKKIFLLTVVLMLSSCSFGLDSAEFYRNPEKLNAWSAQAPMSDLCEAMEEYSDNSYILNRILLEFRRRNISYLNCPQYEDMMEEINKNKRTRV